MKFHYWKQLVLALLFSVGIFSSQFFLTKEVNTYNNTKEVNTYNNTKEVNTYNHKGFKYQFKYKNYKNYKNYKENESYFRALEEFDNFQVHNNPLTGQITLNPLRETSQRETISYHVDKG